jgi:hypothetical protein
VTTTGIILDRPRGTVRPQRSAAPQAGPAGWVALSVAARVLVLVGLATVLTGGLPWSWWLVPATAGAFALNLRAAGRRSGDLLFAASLVPMELFGWLDRRARR